MALSTRFWTALVFGRNANRCGVLAAMIGGAAMALTLLGPVQAQAPPPVPPVAAEGVIGVWFDHSGRAAVAIAPCGTRLCGYISWVKETIDGRGRAIVDKLNPDPNRRGKPICGTRILADLRETGRAHDGRDWGAGQIYNPEEGEQYDVEVSLISPDRLQVLGYAGIKIFSETFIWRRAPADLPSCGPPRV